MPRLSGLAALLAASLMLAGLVVGESPAGADAAGTPGWYYLGYIDHGGAPVLAVDGADDQFVAYALMDPSTGFNQYAIWVAERAAGAGSQLAAPVRVSATGADDSSLYPSIATDAAGDVVVAWYDDGVIYAATKPADTASFSDPVAVSDPEWLADPFVGRQVSVAMDSAGNAIVVWPNTGNGTDFNHGDILVGAMRPVGSSFATATFTSAQQIYDPKDDANNLVALGSVVMSDGQAVVAFDAGAIAYAATWPVDSAKPSGGANLSATYCPGAAQEDVACTNPVIAIDSHGDAVAAFESDNEIQGDPNAGVATLLIATDAGGVWSAATVASGKADDGPVGPIEIAESPNGHDVLAWNETSGPSNTQVTDEVAVGSSPGMLGTPVPLDQPTSYLASVGVDNQGTVLTTWNPALSSSTLESSVLPAGATTWQGPLELAEPTTEPTQLTRADGNTVLAYPTAVNNGVGGAAVALYGFDATGPAFGRVTVPHTATAGQHIGMTAAVDDYTDSTDVSWHFGDGHDGTGLAPHHTYASPGTYSVKVTAVDAAGLSTSATKQITVEPGTLSASTPTISGTARVGHTLTAHPGTWTTGTSFTYRWYASGSRISGATHQTLVLTSHQKGKKIKVEVTGTKTGYRTVTKSSSVTSPVTG